MTIYLDAMGGDNAPLSTLRGAALAVRELNVPVTLVGDEPMLRDLMQKENISLDKLSFVDAKEVITMEEEPAAAVRRKKDSSIVVGCSLVKENPGSAFVSAGSTGAVLAGALFYTGRLKGVSRPALATVLPGEKPVLLIDNGANAECKPEYLVQFAQMGAAYMKAVKGVAEPKVALVNIGTEEVKGTPLYKEAHQLLKDSDISFVGNLETKELLYGAADVAVCDGFTGNIILKTLEGAFKYTLSIVKDVFYMSGKNKLAAAVIKKDLAAKKDSLDPNAMGGVPLLGVKGCVIKAHGSSGEVAIKNAVRQAVDFLERDALGKMSAAVGAEK